MRLQDQLREMQKKLDNTRNQQLSFEHKCKALDEDRSQLQQFVHPFCVFILNMFSIFFAIYIRGLVFSL